ncbi:alpha-amylase family glycosyl hydrolase [Nannocystis bainbridge]|uniref:Alpha-amylase family glycosyl hydrolase n=1 Tax=Nannocystis bainbridge TaxID=2995303 RepID=A0ABT5DNR9_9BACT|nr:alpha-amylase family glycosyl hydrolase [Nannocystis bainbridge]MDC0715297.1 alpha-amylase family glycosyl hydrolase [Nannocystis bainbridge]
MSARIAAAAIAAGLAACEDAAPPRRDCAATVWAQPQRAGATLEIVGSWNSWFSPGIPLRTSAEDPAWQVARFELPPGEYGYLIVEDGVDRVDDHNPLSTFWREQDDLEVSLLRIADCAQPQLVVDGVTATPEGAWTASARLLAGADGSPLVRAEGRASDGTVVPATIDAASGAITLARAGLPRGKHSLALVAVDEAGREARAGAVGWVEPAAERPAEGLLYQIMIDRFRGPGGATLEPPASPGGRAGGTLDGIEAELAAIEALGATGLWLSPVYVNPIEPREGRGDGKFYEGYHGYWPLDSRGVEARIGGEAALRSLIAAAHARGLRVLLDLVPNHVYEDNPRYRMSQAQDLWNMSDPPCVCGLGGCDWGRYIQTCWFTPYLPDLRLERPEALRWAYEDAVWWMETFDIDGLRIDAVPMMPRAATRRIAAEVRERLAPREASFFVGEVFTGPGAWGIEVIRYYLGPDGLDSVFDFPLMWALRDVIAHESAGFAAVEATLVEVEAKTAGSGGTLARMIGNHDVTRFVSEAAGGTAPDPWASPEPQPAEALAYERQALALGLVLTLPGLPVLYYGDEVGLAGGQDPDNRRVMPAWDALPEPQAALLATARRLGTLRRCSPALLRGSRRAVTVTKDAYAFERVTPGGERALVLTSRAGEAQTIALDRLSLAAGEYVDAQTGETLALAPGVSVAMAPRSLRVLLPAGDPCL